MGTRLELHELFLELFADPIEEPVGEEEPAEQTYWGHAYYQPPESVKLEYPCIKYKRAKITTRHANNMVYSTKVRYQVTTITKDPDSTWPSQLLGFPYCSHDRSYTADGLHHNVFELYY